MRLRGGVDLADGSVAERLYNAVAFDAASFATVGFAEALLEAAFVRVEVSLSQPGSERCVITVFLDEC